jgi:8-oxo-dGTP pyrophosphatase MutT (NUDIX family)
MSEPIPSATVILLRDTPSGLKVLLLRRNSDIAYGGSWVFPGGRIDEDEYSAAAGDPLKAARLAAVRETQEEAGINIRDNDLLYFSHWTTPVIRPKRFSTWFFLAPVTDKAVQIDGGEIHAFEWHTPASALAAQADKKIELPPPTFVTLTQLKPFVTVSDALAFFGARDPIQIQPTVVKSADGFVYLYNDDAGYKDANPELPGARHRLVQPHNGNWEYIFEV